MGNEAHEGTEGRRGVEEAQGRCPRIRWSVPGAIEQRTHALLSSARLLSSRLGNHPTMCQDPPNRPPAPAPCTSAGGGDEASPGMAVKSGIGTSLKDCPFCASVSLASLVPAAVGTSDLVLEMVWFGDVRCRHLCLPLHPAGVPV